METFIEHVKHGKTYSTEHDIQYREGRKEHVGKLNFTAYKYGHNQEYLGYNGEFIYGKPFAHDSAAVQSILNNPSYLKRLYYRDDLAIFRAKDQSMAKYAKQIDSTVDAEIKRSKSEDPEGFRKIRADMGKEIVNAGLPNLKHVPRNQPLTFFNTMGDHKYRLKGNGPDRTYNWDRTTHRSTKSELRWIASINMRNDIELVRAPLRKLG